MIGKKSEEDLNICKMSKVEMTRTSKRQVQVWPDIGVKMCPKVFQKLPK